MRILLMIGGFLFSAFTWAFSEAELVQQLQQPQNVQGRFVQQRFLKSLAAPITLQGQFTLVAKKGLLWQLEKPFANQLRVKLDGITQWNGKQWAGNQKPGQSEQIGLFLGLLSGNIDGLKSQFDMKLSGNAQNWKLMLTPNSLLMKQIFTSIEIEGDQTAKRLQLNEVQGDRTQIDFQQIRLNQPLSAFAQSALESAN